MELPSKSHARECIAILSQVKHGLPVYPFLLDVFCLDNVSPLFSHLLDSLFLFGFPINFPVKWREAT